MFPQLTLNARIITLLMMMSILAEVIQAKEKDFVLLLRTDSNRAVHVNALGRVTAEHVSKAQNITMLSAGDYNGLLILTLYVKEVGRYLCFKNYKLIAMKHATTDCHFHEVMKSGYFSYVNVTNADLAIRFTKNYKAVGPKMILSGKLSHSICDSFAKFNASDFFRLNFTANFTANNNISKSVNNLNGTRKSLGITAKTRTMKPFGTNPQQGLDVDKSINSNSDNRFKPILRTTQLPKRRRNRPHEWRGSRKQQKLDNQNDNDFLLQQNIKEKNRQHYERQRKHRKEQERKLCRLHSQKKEHNLPATTSPSGSKKPQPKNLVRLHHRLHRHNGNKLRRHNYRDKYRTERRHKKKHGLGEKQLDAKPGSISITMQPPASSSASVSFSSPPSSSAAVTASLITVATIAKSAIDEVLSVRRRSCSKKKTVS